MKNQCFRGNSQISMALVVVVLSACNVSTNHNQQLANTEKYYKQMCVYHVKNYFNHFYGAHIAST